MMMMMMMMMGYGRRSRSIKAAAASAAAVVWAAVVLRLAGPSIVGFVVDDLPRLYGSVLEWLTPPYLYLVINAIILSIAASSRFSDNPPESGPPTTISVASPPPEIDAYDAGEVTGVAAAAKAKDEEEEEEEEKKEVEEEEEEEFVISRSSWSPKRRRKTTTTTTTTTEIPTTECYSNSREEKPLVSSRFSRRKSARPSPDGKVLGVVRPKRNETLESTWRTITEGRAVPLARHLKKADTWDARPRASADDPVAMRKSETFQDRTRRASPSPSPSPSPSLSPSPSPSRGSGGRLRRGEASLGQDELNRRVEAFINKFNEEMRLQRQESFKQYMDMINTNRTSN